MLGLVPGEDRLFLNTILLRLAETFRSGDKHTRLSVLKVFLLEMRHRKKKGRQYNGILARHRVHNHTELLKRVKIVFDTGDVESRALALYLLGCWADLGKDSAEIRYMILSSMGSCHDLEVKASLFAAGCFSELSEDFATVVLEILINMVSLSKTSSDLRLRGARAFAKMGYSSLLACRAYKTGRKMVLDSSDEDFIVVMLMSLSKLASYSGVLISEQVDLLVSFLAQKSCLNVQVMALRCLCFLCMSGVCRLPISGSLLEALFHLVDKPDIPLDLQCKVLRILHKIFCSLPNLSFVGMVELGKLLQIVENAAKSPAKSKIFLSLYLLVDISSKLRGRIEIASDDDYSTYFPSQVISLVIDQITLLLKKHCWAENELWKECQHLLYLTLSLVKEYSTLGAFVLDKIRVSVESLLNMQEGCIHPRRPNSSANESFEFEGKKRMSNVSKLVICLYRFAEGCVETLNQTSAVTTQVLHNVKLLVICIQQSSLFDPNTFSVHSLCLHYQIMQSCLTNEASGTSNFYKDLYTCQDDYWVEHEKLTLEFAKKMMEMNYTWSAYKLGQYAACQGVWFAATFIFNKLTNKVQTDSNFYWLKSLVLFSSAESNILLFLFPKQGQELVNGFEIHEFGVGEVGEGITSSLQDYGDNLSKACSNICFSEELLSGNVILGRAFYFQRWFLSLRAKVLQTIVDLFRLLSANASQGHIGSNQQAEGSTEIISPGHAEHIHSFMYFVTSISFRLKKLAQEFDLLAISFMDLDADSFRTISVLALNCSLLAFCTGFIPALPGYQNSTTYVSNSEKFSHSFLIQDLAERLWHIDNETISNLKLLLKITGEPEKCSHLQSRTQLLRVGHHERNTLRVCRSAVSAALQLEERTKRMDNEGGLFQLSRGYLKFLSNILKEWICIPFWIPRFFFQVRPCIGAELFASRANNRNPGGLSIFQGFHLSLNLCLQLKDAHHVPSFQLSKLYCILSCRISDFVPIQGEVKGQTQLSFRAWETEEMVSLNEQLLQYVREDMNRTGRRHERESKNCDGSVSACVCLEFNERGQGFSTCMLNVSAFPVGSYKIKWHGCCIDSHGSYWSLLPLNTGPMFTVNKPSLTG
ncbi:PREDICTED: uncharacterized protein LOC104586554 isoform X2 [Nelumbo nucifera]|nr:PREDICTED: uncharacterized protein LOC104586554 isoform X2 [Nelumbo nucifera]